MTASISSDVTTAVDQESWVILNAGESLYAVPSLRVQTMVLLPTVAAVPNQPPHVRGVINLRGQVLPLVDLRVRCGREPLSQHVEQLCKLLEQREQDHRNWLQELEKSVAERRNFTLATDPHKCAFGKWYDQFHTDDLILAGLLRNFDQPHQAIHALAHKVEQLKQAGDFDAANALIAKTRGAELAKLIELFAAARNHLRTSTREIAMVVEIQGKALAVTVDKVESVEHLQAGSAGELPEVLAAQKVGLLLAIAKRKKDQGLVLLLDVEQLLETAAASRAKAA